MIPLSPQQPYPGLRPFDSGDQDYFFGRDAQVRLLRQKLESKRMVAVVGRSGCGKSSLVRAGLVPQLSDQTTDAWRIVTFQPRGRPIAELTEQLVALQLDLHRDPDQKDAGGEIDVSLRNSRIEAMLRRSSQGLVEVARELGLPPGARLLIIVDQFEEIFRFEDTGKRDADEATAFVRLLMEAVGAAAPNIHVILTMRLDFLGDCARFQRLPEAISDGQFLVPNLTRAERRRAIEEPAKKGGKSISPAVTQRLLNDVGEDPDQLPVLQHILMRMWREAPGRDEITLDEYDAVGGFADAISRHADQVYEGLANDDDRLIAERLFRAISERDRGGRAVRRAIPLGEIAATVGRPEASVVRVVNAFRAPECCFLMPPADEPLSAGERVDVSHESLLRRWQKTAGTPTSEGWIAKEDRYGKIYRNLLEAAKANAVLPDAIARERQAWWDSAAPNEAWASRYDNEFERVRTFLENNAKRARDNVLNAERSRRRARYTYATMSVLCLIAVLFGVFAIGENRQKSALETRSSLLELKALDLEAENNRQAAQQREALAKLNAERAAIVEENRQLSQNLDGVRRQLAGALREVPRSALSADVRNTLAETLTAAAVNPDDAIQRAVPGKQSTPAPADNKIGYMWVGSPTRGNLRTIDGTPVLPEQLEKNKEYLVGFDIFLRSGLPDRATYSQQSDLGVLPQGSRVQILNIAEPFPRPTGPQSWAQVRVVSLALPTVYFQFAGGSREQAVAMSRALQDLGYKIPGEERTPKAAGLREVRYFEANDRPAADKLAQNATQLLAQLGYRAQPPIRVVQAAPGPNNPDNNIELWLELPPR